MSTVTSDARVGLGSVRRLVEAHKKTRGIVRAREAVQIASERVASPGETRLRLAAYDTGTGPLLVNAPVFAPDGRLVGIVDLLDEEAGLVLEYDGAGHRQADRHSADNVREEALEDLNLTEVRATASDVAEGVELDGRIVRGRRRGLARRAACDPWTTEPPAWWYGSRLSRRWGNPPWR